MIVDPFLKGATSLSKILKVTLFTRDCVCPFRESVWRRCSVDQTAAEGAGLPEGEFRVEGEERALQGLKFLQMR